MAYFKHYYSHDGFFTASQIIEDAYVSVTLLDFDIDFQGQTVSDVWAFGSFSNAEYINYYIGIDDLELDGDGLCCTNRLMVRVPLSPDGLIPRLQ